jgi:uncharacterized protein YktA (UPF0223 family)
VWQSLWNDFKHYFIIVKDFCATIKKHFKPFKIIVLKKNNIRKMANDFEKLQVIICYIFVVVDVSHVPIIAPFVNSTCYYC